MNYTASQFFAPGALSADPSSDRFFSSVYRDFLNFADEAPLTAITDATAVRFFSIEPEACIVRLDSLSPNTNATIKAANGIIVVDQAQRLTFKTVHLAISDRRLRKLDSLIEKCDLWSQPPSQGAEGLDGWYGIVECAHNGRRVVVDRWCPKGPFGKLCQWFLDVKRDALRKAESNQS